MKAKFFLTCLLVSSIALNAQNVGINNPNPLFPLTFNATLGDKISLWTDGTTTHYGLGIQSGLLQIFSKTDFDNIAFGYGSSNSFNERLRIINRGDVGMVVNGRILLRNGTIPLHPDYGAGIWLNKSDNSGTLGFIGVQNNQNMGFYGGPLGWGLTYDAINSRVGIGINNPQHPLDINGRMRLSGTNPDDPGIWLNDAGVDRAFVGLENNNYVGFYGNQGAGWKFAMNTQTGALKVNGSEGAPGQVLMTSGASGTANWGHPPKPYGFTIIPTQYSSISGVQTTANIEGVNNSTFTLNEQSTIVYTLTLPCYASGPTQIDSKGFVVVEILNSSSTRVSFASSQYYIHRATTITQTVSGIALNLPAGLYTIKARLARSGPPDGNVDTHASLTANEQGIQFIMHVLPN